MEKIGNDVWALWQRSGSDKRAYVGPLGELAKLTMEAMIEFPDGDPARPHLTRGLLQWLVNRTVTPRADKSELMREIQALGISLENTTNSFQAATACYIYFYRHGPSGAHSFSNPTAHDHVSAWRSMPEMAASVLASFEARPNVPVTVVVHSRKFAVHTQVTFLSPLAQPRRVSVV